MKRLNYAGLAALLAGLLLGCESNQSPRPGSPGMMGADETGDGTLTADREIAAQDLLTISIVGETGLQTDYRVSPSGSIQFPFLNLVEVAGLTPDELKAKLEQELSREYFQNPEVIVTVREFSPQYVRVFGAVNRPGLYPVGGDRKMDILDAIASAGGVSLTARKEVIYTHKGERQTISLKDLEDPENRIWVQPGDIIQVEQSIW